MDTNNHNTNADNQNPNGDDHTPDELAAANVTAYALGQLHADERSEFERRHDASNNDIAAQEIRTIESIAAAISASRRAEPATPPSGDLKAKIIDRLDNKPTPVKLPKRSRRLPIVELLVTGGVALV